jgi:hypothetical protein
LGELPVVTAALEEEEADAVGVEAANLSAPPELAAWWR